MDAKRLELSLNEWTKEQREAVLRSGNTGPYPKEYLQIHQKLRTTRFQKILESQVARQNYLVSIGRGDLVPRLQKTFFGEIRYPDKEVGDGG